MYQVSLPFFKKNICPDDAPLPTILSGKKKKGKRKNTLKSFHFEIHFARPVLCL